MSPRARWRADWRALAAVLVALPAAAQPAFDAPAGVSDVPPGPAVVRGRIVHATRPEAAAGVPVLLFARSPGGEPGLRQTTADASGAFVFENVSNATDVLYVVGAKFAEVPFGVSFAFGEGETARQIEVPVADPSPDTAVVRSPEVWLRLDRTCSGLQVAESHALENPTERVIYVPPEARDAAVPILEARIPQAAHDFQTAGGTLQEGLEHTGDRVRFWGPLFPGRQEVVFGYAVSAAGDELELRRGFPAGAERVLVLSPESGAPPSGPQLAAAAPRRVEGRAYSAREATDLAAGETLEIRVPLAPLEGAVDGRPTLTGAQLWLELDDAALVVDEQHRFRVDGDRPLAGEAPLLCLPLPEGAHDLRFAPDSLELGLRPDPDGGLAVYGPLPPGESSLSLRYRIAVTATPMSFVRRFTQAFPLLSILLADTGIRVETERLHRRRPVRSGTRTYMHFEAFEIEPDEPIALTLTPLAPRGGLPRGAAAGILGLTAALATVFLMAPLRTGSEDRPPDADAAEGARAEREAVYRALHDLEDDFDTGKLSEADHEALRRELRGRAVALVRAEQQAERTARAARVAPPAPEACKSCAAPARPGDVFCAQCGTRLA